MEQQNKDLNADKFKLIYEFNNSTSLFTRVASLLIDNGQFVEALEIIEKGLKIHPDYPTAYIIKCLSLAYSGKEIEAKESLLKANEIIGSDETMEFYRIKIEQIIAERNTIKEAKRPSLLESESPKQKTENFEDQLEDLAKKLSSVKIDYDPAENSNEKTFVPEFTRERIASETLAGIYLAQNNYKDAIYVFKELAIKNPAKAEDYAAKIEEIQNIIDEESGIQFNGSDE